MIGYIRISEIPQLIIGVVIGLIMVGLSFPLWDLIAHFPDPVGKILFFAMMFAIMLISYLLAGRLGAWIQDRL
jgi:hypothetical protein